MEGHSTEYLAHATGAIVGSSATDPTNDGPDVAARHVESSKPDPLQTLEASAAAQDVSLPRITATTFETTQTLPHSQHELGTRHHQTRRHKTRPCIASPCLCFCQPAVGRGSGRCARRGQRSPLRIRGVRSPPLPGATARCSNMHLYARLLCDCSHVPRSRATHGYKPLVVSQLCLLRACRKA